MTETKKHAAPKTAREKRAKELDEHFRERTAQGLPAHRPQEYHADVHGVEVNTLAGTVYVKTDGEVELSQDDVFTVIGALQAAFQGAV